MSPCDRTTKKRYCRAKKIFDKAISYDEKKKVSIKFDCFMFLVRDLDAGVVGNILALLHRDLQQQVCDIGQCFFLETTFSMKKITFSMLKGSSLFIILIRKCRRISPNISWIILCMLKLTFSLLKTNFSVWLDWLELLDIHWTQCDGLADLLMHWNKMLQI